MSTMRNFDDLYQEAEAHEDYWLAGAVQNLTEEIVGLMERDGVTRSELARRLGTSPAYITKILRGNANFTLATMVRLARALGAELRVQLEPAAALPQETRMHPESTKRRSVLLEASRQEIRQGRGVPHDEFWADVPT